MSEGRRYHLGGKYRIVTVLADGARSVRLANLDRDEAERLQRELLANRLFPDVVIEPEPIPFDGRLPEPPAALSRPAPA
jgi:hypothetical protein